MSPGNGGRGPAPKDPSKRARGNKDPIPHTFVDVEPLAPMALPDDLLSADYPAWHPATRRWWARWCDSPLAQNLPAVDWSELESCALLHNQFMHDQDYKRAAELRQRMAKFGATPEDRARLRIFVATAEEKDGHKPAETRSARERRGTLHSLPHTKAAGD